MGEVLTNFVAKITVIGKGCLFTWVSDTDRGGPKFPNVLAAQDRGSLYRKGSWNPLSDYQRKSTR